MAIDHLNPPTGNMADNVVGFARALRAAGLPVGPGSVIDAMKALQVIEIGNRADVYTRGNIRIRVIWTGDTKITGASYFDDQMYEAYTRELDKVRTWLKR